MGINGAIDLTPEQKKLILSLLKQYVPGAAVRAFGSRVKFTSRPNSDLDLAVLIAPGDEGKLHALREAFDESNLPFRADILDWNTLPENFRENIQKEYVILQEAEKAGDSDLPNGWNKITLSEFILLQRGFDLPEYSRKNGKVPVVASTGIVGYHDSFQVKGPGVVIGRSGSIGGGQYIEADFWPLNTTLWVKDRKGNDIHYIYYLLKSIDFSIFNAGSGVPTLNRNHLDNIKVFAPPLAEQHAIAHILGTLDDKIELLRRMNKTLEEMARALFKSWFVDFDPVRAKMDGRWTRGGSLPGMPAGMRDLWPSRLVDSELGEIPEGWRVGVVKDVAKSIFSGGTPDTRKAEYWDGNIPWFSSGETRELLITSTEKYISQKGVDESSTRKSVYGDILIASAGQGNTRGQTSFNTIETYINQSVVAIRTDKDKSNPLWLFLNLSNRYEEMRNISDSHSSRGSLTTKLLETMPLILPSKELVDQFFILVNGNINKWIANLIGIKTLMQIRDTLLPKLVSGEVRVPEKRVAEMQKGREGE